MKKTTFTLLILFVANIAFSQIHWATKVLKYTSQYSQDKNSAFEILGVPNVDPQGRPSPYAWAVEPNELDKEAVDWAYIDVGFDSSYFTKQIAIFESYKSGAISAVLVSPFTQEFDSSDTWQLVYYNLDVIKRTGLPDLPGIPDSLYTYAGQKHKRSIFPPDKRFRPKAWADILHIYLENPQNVAKVRIVINPLAVDGWNQIDAVALSDSTEPVKYPQPKIINQSLLLEPEGHNIGKQVNSDKDEIAPVVYPDGSLLFFSRTEYDQDNGIYTQNIWYSQLKTLQFHPRPRETRHQTYTKTVWWAPRKAPWNLNNVLPNAIVNFSSDGQYMFLSNIYTNTGKNYDLEQTFEQDNTGLSVSHLDTITYTLLDSSEVKKLFDKQTFQKYYANPDKNIIIGSIYDSVKNTQNLYLTIKNKDKWSAPFNLRYKNNEKKLLNIKTGNKTNVLWLLIQNSGDSLQINQLKWSAPQPVEIRGFKNYSNYTSYYIAQDFNVMFLAINDSNTIGKRDLYISFYDTLTQSWSKPENLGIPVNTLGDETSPFLDGDGRTLFFASNGHPGYGGYDIYVTYRLGDDWYTWSEPRNLGPKINTGGDELNFSIDQTKRDAYYISNCNNSSKIESDIYKIHIAKPVTLHFKGVTCNCNAGGKPIGHVKLTLKALDSAGFTGDREISFYSDALTGKFDVKITRFIDAERLGQFALFAEKGNYPQADKNCNTIQYIPIDLGGDKWNYDIFVNPCLKGPKPPIKKLKKQPITSDTITEVANQNYEIQEQEIKKKTQPQGNKGKLVTEEFFVPEQKCSYLYYNGQLYLVTLISPEDSTYTLTRMQVNYQKIYNYNEIDFDTDNDYFSYLMSTLTSYLDQFDTATVFIIASASDVPTTQYRSNLELARLRAEEAKTRIIQALDNKYDPSHINFVRKFMVEGEVYMNDPQNINKYKPYQYVKIWVFYCQNE